MGLYRTLLYQILAASPDLMRALFPVQWANALSQVRVQSDYEILDDDIKRAYELLSKQHDGSSSDDDCFALFIDGLDEYQATPAVDRREMVRLLAELVTSNTGRFKICVSSRMENPFMDMFSEDTRLYLHKLTETDMQEYVKGNLRYVGTEQERDQLASSITTKAEGVFLWVVLVVQRIRKQSDDGARFSRLLSEVESLPNELSDLFQRILDSIVESMDRRLMRHTISLLHFLREIKGAREMHLWLDLSDFYFLEDYEADHQFAERASFPNPGSETANERECRASRQLRSICGGLVEANRTSKVGFTHNELGFTHRSVWDFLKQSHIQIEMRDDSFHELEALSQLKLASIKQYWWDAEQQSVSGGSDGKGAERWTLRRHSIMATCLVEQRRTQQLDAPPFEFLECLDTIPQLSVSSTIRRALACGKTAFRITLANNSRKRDSPYFKYEVCHSSRVQHWYDGMDPGLLDFSEGGAAESEPVESRAGAETVAGLWRAADEYVDEIDEYSTAIVSPLLTELCSGRLEYPAWKVMRIRDRPLESDELAVLVHFSIGAGIAPYFWSDPEDDDLKAVVIAAGLFFLRHLFERRIVSPNLVTELAFGGEYGLIRIAAGDQQLSLWQHVVCWWSTVAAACGEFDTARDVVPRPESSNEPFEHHLVGKVLEIFIENGADLHLMLKITARGRVTTSGEDTWLAYTVEMALSGGTARLELDVVLRIGIAMDQAHYPYGQPSRRFWDLSELGREPGPLPDSPLFLRDWIGRSRLPNKHTLFKLMDGQGGDTR
jgi:hypothetical protein